MKKRNLGFKILAAVAALVLLLCPFGCADEAVPQFNGEFISVAEDTIIEAPDELTADIYSVNLLQTSLDEALSFAHIDVDKNNMVVAQFGTGALDDLIVAPETLVVEQTINYYGTPITLYTITYRYESDNEFIFYLKTINAGALGHFDYTCNLEYQQPLFDTYIRTERLNADIPALRYTSEQAEEAARQFIDQYDQTLLGDASVYGCDDYFGVPYYHIKFDTVFGGIRLFEGSYDDYTYSDESTNSMNRIDDSGYEEDLYDEERIINMGGVDIYICDWGVADMKGRLYDDLKVIEKNVGCITALQALEALDSDIHLTKSKIRGQVKRMSFEYYLVPDKADISRFDARPAWCIDAGLFTFIVDAVDGRVINARRGL